MLTHYTYFKERYCHGNICLGDYKCYLSATHSYSLCDLSMNRYLTKLDGSCFDLFPVTAELMRSCNMLCSVLVFGLKRCYSYKCVFLIFTSLISALISAQSCVFVFARCLLSLFLLCWERLANQSALYLSGLSQSFILNNIFWWCSESCLRDMCFD